MINYFIPLYGVGQFELHTRIYVYTEIFDFIFSPADDSTGWETYELDGANLCLYVEKGVIVSIACMEECLYKGRNIIGMKIHEFINYYETYPSGDIDKLYVNNDEIQDVYEFDDLGMQIWCSNDIIVTTIISG